MKKEMVAGQTLRVRWANGHGYTDYRVDDTENGPHVFTVVAEVELGPRGNPVPITRCANCDVRLPGPYGTPGVETLLCSACETAEILAGAATAGPGPFPPASPSQFATLIQFVAEDLRAYAQALRESGWEAEWEPDWSTYALKAQAAVFKQWEEDGFPGFKQAT